MSLVLLVFSIFYVCYAVSLKDIVASPHVKLGSASISFEGARDNERMRSALHHFSYPSQLKSIYGLSDDPTLGAGKTIAIVDAYGASTAERDLAQFNNIFGLPEATSSNGMFLKVNQTGGFEYPPDDLTGMWAMEAALDVQSAHAFAPGAKILLIVCNSPSFSDLMIGVEYARNNADYVSMSWGAPEDTFVHFYEGLFEGSTTSFFASTGDYGSAGGVSYPASSLNVVAVGGTSLYTHPDFTLESEQGWSGSGGGCSTITPSNVAQFETPGYEELHCNGYKALPDLSMLGDPSSGLLVYLSLNSGHGSCVAPNCYWVAGGTSLAAPLVAARSAIRGVQVTPEYIHSAAITFRDIIEGNNGGFSCQPGLDLVTGSGSWIGAL